MNLKYYLRGLGTGILVTALILSISFEVKITKIKSSYEIKQESHSEKQSETATTPKNSDNESEGKVDNQSDSQIESTDEGKKETSTEPKTEPETQPDTTSPKPQASTASVILDIYSGMSSNKVAARLKELGVIENADDFNNYMYANRAESRIHTGKYEIGQDASYEEIVAIITGR